MIQPPINPITATANQDALELKSTLEKENDFTISKLFTLPPYYGEVPIQNECGYMYLGGKDCGTALRLFWNGKYEQTSIEIWEILCKFAHQIYDIGAHTGIYSIVAANSIYPNNEASLPTVHAFEPYLVNLIRLRLNSKLNNIEKKIIINNMAVSDDTGEAEMHVPLTESDYNTAGPTLRKEGIRAKTFTSMKVLCTSIDKYIEKIDRQAKSTKNVRTKDSFNLFKIDVEGNEPAVLRGMSKILANDPPIILIECVNEKPTKESSEILRKFGYSFYKINEQNNILTATDKLSVAKVEYKENCWVLDRDNLNSLCIPPQISRKSLKNYLANK